MKKQIEKGTFYISIPSQFVMIRVVRNTIKELARKMDITDDLCHNIQLVLNEICANIIEHAYFKKPDGTIDIKVKCCDDCIIVQIRDFGKKTDISNIKSRDLDDVQCSGLGVYLIKNLSDNIEYDTSPEVGTLTTVTFKYKSSESNSLS